MLFLFAIPPKIKVFNKFGNKKQVVFDTTILKAGGKKMSKTLRLSFPEWQGGVNPNYSFGCKLLTWLAPTSDSSETIEVPVDKDFEKEAIVTDGVNHKDVIMKQQKAAFDILTIKNPDKVITFGGDCSVEQAPIDYLHGKYPEDTGLIWIDVHPDFSEPEDYPNEHAMVLGNLLGGGEKDLAAMVKNPFEVKNVMYAGLKAGSMETYEQKHMSEYQIKYAGPEELAENSDPIVNWIKENGYKHIYVHLDLDVLSPVDFRSLLCNEPGIPPVEFAVGDMKFAQLFRLLKDISANAEMIGLGITEFMPWDAIRLRQAFEQLDIFND